MNKLTIPKIFTKGLKNFFLTAFLVLKTTNVNAVTITGTIETTFTEFEAIFQGIELASGSTTFILDQEIPGFGSSFKQEAKSLRIDLQNPHIQFFSTPSNADFPEETNAQTTSNFLDEYDLQVAINANFFSPCCNSSSEPKDLKGLAISDGNIVSPAEENFESLLITQDNNVDIAPTSVGDDFSNIFTAVSGNQILLENGNISVNPILDYPTPTSFQLDVDNFPEDLFAILGTEFAPRTAVGISQDEESLILLAIDGRQPGFSIGATPYQSAQWLDRFGAFQGLNLDGGGSTTMVREDEFGNPLVLNSPSDGSERFNGNNLGVFAKPIPEPLTILGTTIALAFGAMFKGKNTLNREAE